jgi:hypothetical protein
MIGLDWNGREQLKPSTALGQMLQAVSPLDGL